MHSHSYDGETFIHYNSDWSGDVHIIHNPEDGERQEMRIPGEAILEAVAYGYVMPRRVSEIEGKSAEELLSDA